MAAEQPAKRKRGYIIDLHGEQEIKQITVGVRRIRKEAKMAKHPANVDETHYSERNGLELVLGPIPHDRYQENERNHVHRHGHEQAIPSRRWIIAAGVAHQR